MGNSINNSEQIQELMLSASELFHYASKFRNSIFLLSVGTQKIFRELNMDLQVLLASQVPCVLVLETGVDFVQTIERLNTRGFLYRAFEVADIGDISRSVLNECFAEGQIPLLIKRKSNIRFEDFCVDLAGDIAADKLFFFLEDRGLFIDGTFRSHLNLSDLDVVLSTDSSFNCDKDFLLSLYRSQVIYGFDVVFLQDQSGSLFQEIFTYRGIGTLITNNYPNCLRRAIVKDVADILFLMKPAMANGLILPVSEDEIAANINSFYVFTVDQVLVACASLKDFGEYFELGKICTLPRYQGRGRARELSRLMIEEARKMGKKGIFSLSIEPLMWEFFINLGFVECDRDLLPSNWKKYYDFSRKSKAFMFNL